MSELRVTLWVRVGWRSFASVVCFRRLACFSAQNQHRILQYLAHLAARHYKRGPRSFGAKNNDPLEVFVFIGLFESPLLTWVERTRQTAEVGKRTLFMGEIQR
jgi:hypothetical protein